MRIYHIISVALCLFSFYSIQVLSQSVYVPLDGWYNHLLDRAELSRGTVNQLLHLSSKPLLRSDVVLQSIEDTLSKTKRDKFNTLYLQRDNADYMSDTIAAIQHQKPLIKWFYKTHQAMYGVREQEFTLVVNPVIGLGVSNIQHPELFSQMTRGVEVRGQIAKRLGFYSTITENSVYFPEYTRQRINQSGAVPSQGFWKYAADRIGYEFFGARGYITLPLLKKYIYAQFGQDKNFIGNGHRSLILSDQSARYLFVKITTRIWRIQYTNLYADMTDRIINANKLNTRKYMVLHHLSYNITPKLNVGLFEHIMFTRGDSGQSGMYELNYLNPIIFYREVESYLGSKDKVTLGTDFKYIPCKKIALYGQFVLNEFVIRYLRSSTGWWGNKYAYQIGMKYIDALGLRNVDVQIEYNRIRPYTYADKESATSFAHYQQPLAHPLGANLSEWIATARYQPLKRLFIQGTYIHTMQGLDTLGVNWGGDVLKPYTTRQREFDNKVGQGIRTQTALARLYVSYMIFHNVFLDFSYTRRVSENVLTKHQTDLYTIGFRCNLSAWQQDW